MGQVSHLMVEALDLLRPLTTGVHMNSAAVQLAYWIHGCRHDWANVADLCQRFLDQDPSSEQRSVATLELVTALTSVRDAATGWHATSYEGNEAVLDSGWATARVAPTRASAPGCSVQGRRYRARRARRRPCRFPDGLVRVGTGRRKGVARHLVRRKRSRAGFGMGDRKGRPYAASGGQRS